MLRREDHDLHSVGGELVEFVDDRAIIGPFRKRERAERRAGVVRKLAERYEDPEGVTGPENCLFVTVEPVLRGSVSAQDALDVLYGSIPADEIR